MVLNDAQHIILGDHIDANTNTIMVAGVPTPIQDVPHIADLAPDVAAWYNGLVSPAYKVYRTNVPIREVMRNGFDWTRVDNLNVGKARVWDWMKEAYGTAADPALDPSDPDCRAGINTVWVGTAADLVVRAAIYLHSVRDATIAEQLFKVAGNGTAPDQNGDGPATMGPEGAVTAQNIILAWAA